MAELARQYRPGEVEEAILKRWLESGAFNAEPGGNGRAGAEPYCIVIPPPNVTSQLHLGHALNNTLQDILIRWKRMCGYRTLWMPGTDHAGIATQTVVEKRVLAEQGKRRTDFQREEFVKLIQAWKDEYEATITNQLKRMGCSCDWRRQRFTMDPVCAAAVREAFFRLFEAGLIYRGKRLVNWDPATQTALADDEVEMEEVDGHFYYLRYPLVEAVEFQGRRMEYVTVATTRPETMLGDTAVAINPKDPRAAVLRGKKVRLPIVNRVVPIIEDDYVVLPVEYGGDPEDPKAQYATGFLKVTPAHDPNDWEIGQRHGLAVINVFSPSATISKDHGWPAEDFQQGGDELRGLLGLDRFEAREAIVEWFREEGLLEAVRPYRHAVGHSYRSHVPIEPYLSDQWYVDVDKDFGTGHECSDPRGGCVPGTRIPRNSLAGLALRAMAVDQREGEFGELSRREGVREGRWEGRLRFIPGRYARMFQAWHENIRDWCISRQLWWGHRIPVWSKAGGRAEGWPRGRAAVQVIEGVTYVCLREDEPGLIAELEREGFVQDPDVLDTWFSSALWPISTMGWPNPGRFPEAFPEGEAVLRTWNPSNALCTAREILTLWVSRMVMFNLYLRGCLPFYEVFVHAMIQDGLGRKMSKSLGNGVDPLDIIETHGADAMRFVLAQMTTQTQDVRMPVEKDPATGKNTSPKFDLGRNFANKLWNAVRFAITNLEEAGAGEGEEGLGLAERWILSRLARRVHDSGTALERYEFSDYAQGLYDFVWRDLCDWYIEAIKPTLRDSAVQRRVLAVCVDVSLRLLHPVMPFITEALWEHLNRVAPERGLEGVEIPRSELLVKAAWPRVSTRWLDPEAEKEFELVQEIVTAIRQVRTEYKVPPRQVLECTARAPAELAGVALANRGLIERLAGIRGGEIGPGVSRPRDAAVAVVREMEIYVHGLVDVEAERQRLRKRLDELAKTVARLEARLANPEYLQRAPAHLVEETRQQLSAAKKEQESLSQQLTLLD